MCEKIRHYMSLNLKPVPPIEIISHICVIIVTKYMYYLNFIQLKNCNCYLLCFFFLQLHDVPSDPRGAGICAFTSRDIKKNEIICEYGREVVTEEEARAQEMLSHFPPPPLLTE